MIAGKQCVQGGNAGQALSPQQQQRPHGLLMCYNCCYDVTAEGFSAWLLPESNLAVVLETAWALQAE
jgi:hypothetical protein